MEGVGSTRVGRASARYGSTAVFNGPVRKWKKKWVHVSPSSTAKHSQSHGNNNGEGSSPSSIVLCRWTPLSFDDSGLPGSAVDGEVGEQQPPKRKFRYTPVAVLEEDRKRAATKQVEDEEAKTVEKEANQSPDWLSKSDNELNMNKDVKKETQDSSMGNLDLNDGSHDSVGEKEAEEKAANSAGFWAMA